MAYLTVARTTVKKLVICRSTFVACTREVTDELLARTFLAEVRTAEAEADHHGYAYRLGAEKAELSHYSDDGEPSGTAGRPILGALLAARVTNAMVVVSRYFGGRKLGIPGLIEAYHTAATDVLAKAGTIIRIPSCLMELTVAYDRLEALRHLLRVHGAKEVSATYGHEVELRLGVPVTEKARLIGALAALGLRPHEA